MARLPPPEHSRFKKGDNPNPNGRGKGTKNLTTLLMALLDQETMGKDLDGSKVKMPAKAAIITRLILEAKEGSLGHINTVLERVEGKVVQPVEDITTVDKSVDEGILGKYEMSIRKKKIKQEVVD